MKSLFLMRHAKSSWKEPNLPDFQRPLNKRGKKDAPLMGKHLKAQNLVPQTILSSSAVRARQTVESLSEAAGFNGEIIFLDQLYMAEADEYLRALREVPDSIDRVMVVGHNPGLETLLQILTNQIHALPTAVIARLALPIERWSSLSAETSGELVEIWLPREFKKEENKEKEKEKGKEKSKKKKKSGE